MFFLIEYVTIFCCFVFISVELKRITALDAHNTFEYVNTTVSAGRDVDIKSYKAVIGILTTINTKELISWASLGCFNVGAIDLSGPDSSNCRGDYSCSFSKNMNVGGNLICYGAGSCSYSDYLHLTDHDDINGVAAFSLGNSYVSGASHIYSQGAFALMNSIIDSGNLNRSIYVEFGGYLSGYNATFTCRNGDSCIADCYGNGCFGMLVIKEDESNCSVLCDISQATYCPTIVNLTEIIANETEIENNLENDEYTPLWYAQIVDYIEEYDYKCNLNSSLRFDDYEWNSNVGGDGPVHSPSKIIVENSTNNDLSFICCLSYRACSSLTNLTHISTYGSVYCGGYQSCVLISIEAKASGSNVMCSGDWSCYYNTITTEGNVTCSGYFGCRFGTIYNAHSLLCAGTYACDTMTVYGVSNIYLMGYSAWPNGMEIFSNSTDYNISQDYDDDEERQVLNVHMMSYLSGKNVEIYCHKRHTCNVYCYTIGACDSDTTTVYCDGMFVYFFRFLCFSCFFFVSFWFRFLCLCCSFVYFFFLCVFLFGVVCFFFLFCLQLKQVHASCCVMKQQGLNVHQ